MRHGADVRFPHSLPPVDCPLTTAAEPPKDNTPRAATGTTERLASPGLLALVGAARRGDMAAQSALVQLYTARLSGFVYSLVNRRSAVEDIVQVVLVKMLRGVRLLRDPRVFEPWLFRLARNAAYDHLRRRQTDIVTVWAEEEMFAAPDTTGGATSTEILEALDIALTRLKPRDRFLISRILQGHSHRAIAPLMGISPGALKVRLHRLRPVLRAIIQEALGESLPLRSRAFFAPRAA